MSKLGDALRQRYRTPALALRALGISEDLLALDEVIPAHQRRYKHPENVLARLGLDETLLDNPSNTENTMDADQVMEDLKAAIADMDEEERYRLMQMLSELVADEDSVPPDGVTPTTTQDRRRLASDARLTRHFNSPHVRAIERELSARAKGSASFDRMFPQARRIGIS